jgi:hypothetical protein
VASASTLLESRCSNSQQQSETADRKKVVVFIGLEGSGHHVVEKVIEDYLDLKDFHCPSEVVEGHIGFEDKFMHFANEQPYTIFGQVSFPEKRPGGELRETAHPALISMVCLNVTKLIDLRLVYLRRNPSDAVCSAIRRYAKDRDDEHEIEAYVKVAVDSLLYINSVLRQPEVSHEIVDFVEALTDSKSMSTALQYALAGIAPHDSIEQALGKGIELNHRHNDFDCPHRDYIDATLMKASGFLEPWMIPGAESTQNQ